MSVYTLVNLIDKIKLRIYQNGIGAITGAIHQEISIDMVDSLENLINTMSGVSYKQGVINEADLTDNGNGTYQITRYHTLITYVPIVYLWDANGVPLGEAQFTPQAISSGSITITFEELVAFPVKMLIEKKVTDISEVLDYISVLFVDFVSSLYEGAPYYRQPVGWLSYTKLGNGTVEDHLSEDTNFNDDTPANGIEILNRPTGTQYLLLLESTTRYVEAGNTYRIQMTGQHADGYDINMVICGQNVVIPGGGAYGIDVNIVVTTTEKFYIQTDSDEDVVMTILTLTVTRL